jgi:hypothetical protein
MVDVGVGDHQVFDVDDLVSVPCESLAEGLAVAAHAALVGHPRVHQDGHTGVDDVAGDVTGRELHLELDARDGLRSGAQPALAHSLETDDSFV